MSFINRVFFLILFVGASQVLSAQAVKGGDVLVEFNGGPSSFGDQYWMSFNIWNANEFNYNWSIAPSGSITVMFNRYIGMGLNGEYHQASADIVDFNGNAQRIYMRRIRVSSHFEWEMINEDGLNVYLRTGFGVKRTTLLGANGAFPQFIGSDFFPIAFRTAIGVRLWAEKMVSFSIEAGLGGGANFKAGIGLNLNQIVEHNKYQVAQIR